MINGISSHQFNYQIPESQVERPEGFQGSSQDAFVRDQDKELEKEKSFREMGELFLAKKKPTGKEKNKNKKPNNYQGPGSIKHPPQDTIISGGPIEMFPGREGYRSDFLGVEYPLPTLGDSIKDKAAHLIDHPDEIELKYNHFSIVQNAERKQCFFTACNIDGTQCKDEPREGKWSIDGRIPREAQLGNEAYGDNDIDKGHMVRRLDPAWGNSSKMGSTDTFVYTNAALQHAELNQKEWLELENHVLDAAKGQKMTVLTGPVFSDSDRTFTNRGHIKGGVKMPEQFWKMCVWKDVHTGELKGAAFVISQKDILDRHPLIFKNVKNGIEPGRFSVYQVPITKLEDMTDLHFAPVADITKEACCLSDTPTGAPIM